MEKLKVIGPHHNVLRAADKYPCDSGYLTMNKGRMGKLILIFATGILLPLAVAAPAQPRHAAAACARVTIEGEVAAGQEWSSPIGQGWVFRVMPIQPADKYTGWDLVLDRVQPAGFPDALYLATPPYGSLNEREIGTTYGLRAQDAIGWNPRSFRFLTDPAAFRAAQQAFHAMSKQPRPPHSEQSAPDEATTRLLDLIASAAQGEFRILDARLAPGIADPAPYAQSWALAASRTPHEDIQSPSGTASERGSLLWMRFSISLMLPSGSLTPPAGWPHPAGWNSAAVPCPVK
jgi:hypothetical protein